jgi:hypothetical protein
MLFRRVGRRPDRGAPILQLILLLGLLFLMGGGVSPSYPAGSVDDSMPGLTPKPVWVFLSQEGWEDSRFWDALGTMPVEPRVVSEWLRGISLDVDPGLVDRLRNLPGVVDVRPVGRLPTVRPRGVSLSAAPPAPASQAADSIYGDLASALEQLGIPEAHSLGLTGAGVRIGILDGTFLEGHSALRLQPPLAVRDLVDMDGSVLPDPGDPPEAASHGTALWSLLSADLPGVLRGSAPGGEIVLARIRSTGDLTTVDEDRWVAGLEWLESQGARIVLSGVSFRDFAGSGHTIDDLDGNTAPATRAADQAGSRGVLVVAPVGNGGPELQTLGAPSDGDSVMASGAVDANGVPAAFSALGPTADGRDKPDLYAPGTGLQAASGTGTQMFERVDGTEFAGALLAGAASLLVEAHPDRGPMEVLEILQASTRADTGAVVGVPNVASAILFPEGVVPFPVEEVGEGGQVTNLAPQFRWTVPTVYPLGLPVTFHIELAEDSLFRTISRSDSVVGTFARRLSAPLAPRTRLFWRVRATSVQGVGRSTEAQGPLLVPSWVNLEVLNEPGGSELRDPQPLFRWTSPLLFPPAGPLLFDLQVVSDRDTEIVQSYPGLGDQEFRIPSPLPFNVPLRWRVIARTREGAADTVTSAGPFVVTSGTAPPATILYQNFPNPFPNRELGLEKTRIWFDLARTSFVELAVYDIRGRLVRRLIPARGCSAVELSPGIYGRDDPGGGDPCQSFSWDGRDDRDRDVSPGVYLLRLRAGGVESVRRMVFWK